MPSAAPKKSMLEEIQEQEEREAAAALEAVRAAGGGAAPGMSLPRAFVQLSVFRWVFQDCVLRVSVCARTAHKHTWCTDTRAYTHAHACALIRVPCVLLQHLAGRRWRAGVHPAGRAPQELLWGHRPQA